MLAHRVPPVDRETARFSRAFCQADGSASADADLHVPAAQLPPDCPALPPAMRDAGLHWAVNEVHVLWRGYWQLTDRHRRGITAPVQSTPFGARDQG